MIHVIDNYYLTFDNQNITLYEERMVVPKNGNTDEAEAEREANLKRKAISWHSPHMAVGLPSVYKKLVQLKVEQEVVAPLLGLVEYVESKGDEIKEAVIAAGLEAGQDKKAGEDG